MSDQPANGEEQAQPEAPEGQDAGGAVWDAPNQQTVRPDQSAPWEEGTGGTPGDLTPQGDQADTGQADTGAQASADPSIPSGAELDAMTVGQLLEYAKTIGASPANSGMTKAELRESIDAKQAQG